jgi:hypothetical protein
MALLIVNPGFSLCSNPGLKLANAFGVKFKLRDGLITDHLDLSSPFGNNALV